MSEWEVLALEAVALAEEMEASARRWRRVASFLAGVFLGQAVLIILETVFR